MNKRIFKVAVVGCGTISPNHLSSIAALDNVKVVALCDTKPEKAEDKKIEFGLDAKIYTDYYEMLETEELDAVHIATPHYLHAPMTIAAFKKDIDVFLEKPMCINIEQIKEMLEAEKNSKARACVCFQNRFNPSTLTAKSIVEEDGGALSAYGTVIWQRTAPYYTESGWRGTYATEGGGVMINQAIHTLDLLCQFMGKPEKLWATKSNHHLKDVIEVEDSCEGMVEFEGGKFGNFYATTAFHFANSTVVFIKTKNHRLEIRDNRLYVDYKLVEEATTENFMVKAEYGNGHLYLIKEFYKAIENGTPMPITLESAQYAVRLLLAAYRSNDEETII